MKRLLVIVHSQVVYVVEGSCRPDNSRFLVSIYLYFFVANTNSKHRAPSAKSGVPCILMYMGHQVFLSRVLSIAHFSVRKGHT